MRFFKRLLVCTGLALAAISMVPGIAHAVDVSPVTDSEQVALSTVVDWAQVIGLIVGFAAPFVVVWLTKYGSQLWVKSLVAGVTIALPALATYLGDVSGARTWEGALSVFVVALFSAGASRTVLTGGADTALAKVIALKRAKAGKADFGFGKVEPQDGRGVA